MTIPYGEGKEVFRVSLFVVLCNRLTSCLLAVAILLVSSCSHMQLLMPLACQTSPAHVHIKLLSCVS